MEKRIILISIITGTAIGLLALLETLLKIDMSIIAMPIATVIALVSIITVLSANNFRVLRCKVRCEAKYVQPKEGEVNKAHKYEIIINGQKRTITSPRPIVQEEMKVNGDQTLYVSPTTNEYVTVQNRKNSLNEIKYLTLAYLAIMALFLIGNLS